MPLYHCGFSFPFPSFIKLSLSQPTSFLGFALTILSPDELIILMSGVSK